jgi:hypothetical protein
MQYYNPPSPNAGATALDRWNIDVTVVDGSSNSVSVSSTDAGFNSLVCTTATNCDFIRYETLTGVTTSDNLNWPGVDPALPDQKDDTGLSFSNIGNGDVDNENVIGQDLCATGQCGTQEIKVAAFSVGGACDAPGGGGPGTAGIILIDNSPVVVPLTISYTATPAPSGTMHFCIWDSLSNGHILGSAVSQYVANTANSNRWDITFNS